MASSAAGADIYITQAASGVDSGASCADGHSTAWFNANATGGNNYHLCGTFTGGPNTTVLSPSNGGTSGFPLIITFEPGAVLSSPQWSSNGAIYINRKSYVVVDGGKDGTIRNTDNGTGLTYHQNSAGVVVSSNSPLSSYVEIKNLTINNIYQQSTDSATTDTDGQSTSGIDLGGCTEAMSAHGNKVNGARQGIAWGYSGCAVTAGAQIYQNTISKTVFGVVVASTTGTTATANGVVVYGNTISDWWKYPSSYHKDGIFLSKVEGNTVPTTIDVFNNYIYGDMTPGSTAAVYCTWAPGTGSTNNLNCRVYNNLVVLSPGGNGIWLNNGTGTGGHLVFNNTLIGPGGSMASYGVTFGGDVGVAPKATLRNNILQGWSRAYAFENGSSASAITADRDLLYDINAGMTSVIASSPSYSWSQWQAAGYDLAGRYADPKLDPLNKPLTGSPAVALGANLSNLGITALGFDKAGLARPTTGAWDVGAYQNARQPAPPANLNITVR